LRLKLNFLDVIEVVTQTHVIQLPDKVVAVAVAEIMLQRLRLNNDAIITQCIVRAHEYIEQRNSYQRHRKRFVVIKLSKCTGRIGISHSWLNA